MSKKLPKEVSEIQNHKRLKIDYTLDKSVSFSQFYTFQTCPHQWYLTYVSKLAPYQPSVHALFGTSMHETIQKWLNEMFTNSIKSSIEMDLNSLLEDRIINNFKKEKYKNSNQKFSNPEELEEFYNDGVNILNFLKKKRYDYFPTKFMHFVGDEIPLTLEIKPGLFFKGFIDLVFYDELNEKFYLYDLKTSTKGWTDYAKKDDSKIGQLVLYKHFFSKQFNIDPDKISVEYLILKRKIPLESEFTPKYIQRFSPTAGKIKTKQILNMFNSFIETAFDDNGNYQTIDFEKKPSSNNCKFCPFNNNKFLCNVGVF